MKDILTEWRKFVNEGLYDSFRTSRGIEDYFKKPDTTIDELIQEVLNQAEELVYFLAPPDPEEFEDRDDKELIQRIMSDINIYMSNWFENHEVKEEDKEKANAVKTFVDWLNRNLEEMVEISYSAEEWSDLDSKLLRILTHIAKDTRPHGPERLSGPQSMDMLLSLAPQLDKF